MNHPHSYAHAPEPQHHHHGESRGSQAVTLSPGLSLLRMSAASRLGLALMLSALLWAATYAVLG